VRMELELLLGGSFCLDVSLVFDHLGVAFRVVVLFVSSCVLVYSPYYMGLGERYVMYSFLVKCFVFSMLIFVCSPNLLSLILG